MLCTFGSLCAEEGSSFEMKILNPDGLVKEPTRCCFIISLKLGSLFFQLGYAIKDFSGSILIDLAGLTKRIPSEAGLHSRFPGQIHRQVETNSGSGQ
jgi:hypothetical protein